MLKLIHADLYKTFHRAYYFVMMLLISALCVAMVFALRGGQYGNWSGSADLAVSMLSYPVLLLPMLTQIVSAEEYHDHTLKNTLSFGTNRAALFVSKWLTAILLGVLLTAVVLAFYFGSSAMLLSKDASFKGLGEFFIRLGAACSVYAACISMSVCFIALFNRSTLAIFLYYGAFYLTDLLLKLFHLSGGVDYLLKTQINSICAVPIAQLQTHVVISLVTMAVFFVAGLALFRRKDFC